MTVWLQRSERPAFVGAPLVVPVGKMREKLSMEEASDGTWTYTGASQEPEVRYSIQLKLADKPRWIPNPAAPVVFDKWGFVSIAKVENGQYTVRFDPKTLEVKARGEAKVVFSNESSVTARAHRIAEAFARNAVRVMDELKAPPKESSQERARAVRAPMTQKLLGWYRDEKAPRLVRELSAVLVFMAGEVSRETRQELASFLPIDSIAWSAYPIAQHGHIGPIVGDAARTLGYVEEMSEKHPDRSVRGEAVYALSKEYEKRGDLEKADRLLRKASADYSDVRGVKLGLGREKRSRKRLAGAPFPDLKLTTLDGKALDAESMKGRHTLVEFSAYGCGACISVIPDLAKVRASHPEDRLRMVTVTLHADDETLKEILASQPPQPWEHVALPDGDDLHQRLSEWEVWWYPTFFRRARREDRRRRLGALQPRRAHRRREVPRSARRGPPSRVPFAAVRAAAPGRASPGCPRWC